MYHIALLFIGIYFILFTITAVHVWLLGQIAGSIFTVGCRYAIYHGLTRFLGLSLSIKPKPQSIPSPNIHASRQDNIDLQELLKDVLSQELNTSDIDNRLDLICPEDNTLRKQLMTMFQTINQSKDKLPGSEAIIDQVNETFTMANLEDAADQNEINMREINRQTQTLAEKLGVDSKMTQDLTSNFMRYMQNDISKQEFVDYANSQAKMDSNPALNSLMKNFEALKAAQNGASE